jgi:two-component system, OmpR family, response regulator
MAIQKVLLVDDEDDIRTIGQLSLARVGGWQCALAPNGQVALELAESFRPDLVLLDVMMPGMDGPTTFEALRALEATRTVPIIFMTAKVQKHEVARYLELGALGVISKPFDPMRLPVEIRRLLDAAAAAPGGA